MDGAKKLAYLLEGCGAKYTRTIVTEGTLFIVLTGDEQYFVLVRDDGAGIEMWSRYFTPEQAIAATVGERNPDGLPIGLTVSNDGNLLNWVGENYVRQDAATVDRRDTMGLWSEWEQVLFANVSDEVAQDNLNECVHDLLDKAATVGAGTCHSTSNWTNVFKCSMCGFEYDFITDPYQGPKFCPRCGRKVVVK